METRKLSLNKEVIAQLTDSELKVVIGGKLTDIHECSTSPVLTCEDSCITINHPACPEATFGCVPTVGVGDTCVPYECAGRYTEIPYECAG